MTAAATQKSIVIKFTADTKTIMTALKGMNKALTDINTKLAAANRMLGTMATKANAVAASYTKLTSAATKATVAVKAAAMAQKGVRGGRTSILSAVASTKGADAMARAVAKRDLASAALLNARAANASRPRPGPTPEQIAERQAGRNYRAVRAARQAYYSSPGVMYGMQMKRGFNQLDSAFGMVTSGIRRWAMPLSMAFGGAVAIIKKFVDTMGDIEMDRVTIAMSMQKSSRKGMGPFEDWGTAMNASGLVQRRLIEAAVHSPISADEAIKSYQIMQPNLAKTGLSEAEIIRVAITAAEATKMGRLKTGTAPMDIKQLLQGKKGMVISESFLRENAEEINKVLKTQGRKAALAMINSIMEATDEQKSTMAGTWQGMWEGMIDTARLLVNEAGILIFAQAKGWVATWTNAMNDPKSRQKIIAQIQGFMYGLKEFVVGFAQFIIMLYRNKALIWQLVKGFAYLAAAINIGKLLGMLMAGFLNVGSASLLLSRNMAQLSFSIAGVTGASTAAITALEVQAVRAANIARAANIVGLVGAAAFGYSMYMDHKGEQGQIDLIEGRDNPWGKRDFGETKVLGGLAGQSLIANMKAMVEKRAMDAEMAKIFDPYKAGNEIKDAKTNVDARGSHITVVQNIKADNPARIAGEAMQAAFTSVVSRPLSGVMGLGSVAFSR